MNDSMKNAMRVTVSMFVLQLSLPATLVAQETVQPPTGLRIVTAGRASQSNAIQGFRALAIFLAGPGVQSKAGEISVQTPGRDHI